MTQKFATRSAWKRAYSFRLNGYLKAGERYMELAPHEAPSYIRRPYSATEWLALTPAERRAQHRKNGAEFITSKLGPAPDPVMTSTLTVAALERKVVRETDKLCDDLRFYLNGTPEEVEAAVAAQLPALRARVFDDLTSRFTIVGDV